MASDSTTPRSILSPRALVAGVALTLVTLVGCGPTLRRSPSRHPPTPASQPRPGAYEGVEGAPVTPRPGGVAGETVRLAEALLGVPYHYGGESRRGFDCSGLTSYVYARAGHPIPRTAQQQASVGSWVALDELSAGDLVFFGDQRDKLYHVGLVVSAAGAPLEMIHSASSRGVVRTVVVDSRYWLERLEFGRRVLP